MNLKTPIPDHLATYFHSIIGKPSQVKARKENQTYAKLEMDKHNIATLLSKVLTLGICHPEKNKNCFILHTLTFLQNK